MSGQIRPKLVKFSNSFLNKNANIVQFCLRIPKLSIALTKCQKVVCPNCVSKSDVISLACFFGHCTSKKDIALKLCISAAGIMLYNSIFDKLKCLL